MNIHVSQFQRKPARPSGAAADPSTAALNRKMRGPIVAGCVVIGICVVGVMAWAGFTSISGAVVASGVVRSEGNRKTIKHLEGGIVEQILVKEGDRVSRGQLLMVFDDVRPGAQLQVLRQQSDALLAQHARYQAELSGASALSFSPELLARQAEPGVATLIRDERNVFTTELMVLQSRTEVIRQRIQQLQTRIGGLRAQVASTEAQSELIKEELGGLQELFEKGYAPKTRVLALERTVAALGGTRGAQVAEISRTQEAIGEAQTELIKLRQERVSTAAEAVRDIQVRLADLTPRIRATESALAQTRVVAPDAGYVLNLTQFTENGVVTPAERLLDIVPVDSPVVIDAQIAPTDIDEITTGMTARVRLSAYSAQRTRPVEAEVVTVSADRLIEERSGEPYFRAQLRIPPEELAKLGGGVRLDPGMPAEVMILTGERTILGYIFGPLSNALRGSMREQ